MDCYVCLLFYGEFACWVMFVVVGLCLCRFVGGWFVDGWWVFTYDTGLVCAAFCFLVLLVFLCGLWVLFSDLYCETLYFSYNYHLTVCNGVRMG